MVISKLMGIERPDLHSMAEYFEQELTYQLITRPETPQINVSLNKMLKQGQLIVVNDELAELR